MDGARVRPAWAVPLGVVAWLVALAWLRPLAMPDEGRYAGVAWEMLRSGDWLTPTLSGLPFFHKPPLFYWITAGALTAFGPIEWAARAAPLAGAGAAAVALYLFTRRWADARHAGVAVLVLATQPFFYVGAQFANLDMLVAGCISAAVLLFAHAALSRIDGLPYRRAVLGAYAAAALGVLAKGLIGAVLPALVIAAWLLALRRPRVLLALLWWPGLLLFMLLAGPWFVAMQGRYPGFLDYFFVVQHFQRFAQAGFNNAQPFWFYPAVIALLALPWTVWALRLLRPAYWREPAGQPVRLLMAIWLVAIVGFFSLPKSKLVGYVLPALAPLAWLVADAALAWRPGAALAASRVWRACAVLAIGFCVVAVVVIARVQPHSHKALGLALREQRGAGEPVVFAGEYFYDVVFYARLFEPARVADRWDDPEIARHDNWRKELADAAAFEPQRAARSLVAPDAVRDGLCAAPVTWIVAAPAAEAAWPFLAQARLVMRTKEAALWRVAPADPALASALRCPGTPNADSAGK